jgi:putative cardiolipin synthase
MICKKMSFKGIVFCGAAVVFAGCTTVPERELENAFKYQRLTPSGESWVQPIESEYRDLAFTAWDNMEAGQTEQYVSMLEIGDDALLARIHLIRSARHTIDVQTFIWKNDPTGRFVFDELVKAARRGVEVRLLIDALNIPGTAKELAQMAHAHRNLEVCLYKPLADRAELGRIGFWDNVLFKTRRMNRRMHNKLVLVDGHIGIAGGRNYEGKYYDRDTKFLFHDRDIIVAGPAVMDMEDSFELFWQDKNAVYLTQLKDVQKEFAQLTNAKKPFLDPDDRWLFAEIDQQANERSLSAVRDSIKVYEADEVHFIYDTPRKFRSDKEHMDFNDWFEKTITAAEVQLVYQTPYLFYSKNSRKQFNELKKANPKFRIIASSNSLAAADHIHVYALSFRQRKELFKKAGIDIYESKPYPKDNVNYVHNYEALVTQAIKESGGDGSEVKDVSRAGPLLCIHAKSYVVDRKVAMIGSHNFDPRSAKLNTECGVFIFDEEVAGVLEDHILNACAPQNAWTVSKAPTIPVISHFSGFLGAISSMIPFFDVWPYRYTNNYELKDGCEPLLPRAENFQDNYINVGIFPEVQSGAKATKTRLMKAFGGWATSFM